MPMNCPNCGRPVTDGVPYCSFCGSRVEVLRTAPDRAYTPDPAAAPAPAAGRTKASVRARLSMVFGLIALILPLLNTACVFLLPRSAVGTVFAGISLPTVIIGGLGFALALTAVILGSVSRKDSPKSRGAGRAGLITGITGMVLNPAAAALQALLPLISRL